MSDLVKLLEDVKDKNSFFVFVKALLKDRKDEVEKEKMNPSGTYGQEQKGWENRTIEQFLDAAIAGTTDNRVWVAETEKGPSWKLFAEFLYLGKIYE